MSSHFQSKGFIPCDVTKLGLGNKALLQLINLRRQDKIVLTQPADCVGPNLDPEILVAPEMQVGVMLFPSASSATFSKKLIPARNS